MSATTRTLRLPSAPLPDAQPVMDTGAFALAREFAVRVPSRAVAWGSAEDTAQLGPPTEVPKARAGTVKDESEPTRPVMGTAIVVPARPRTRRARST